MTTMIKMTSKLRAELSRAFRGHKYDRTDSGLYFSGAKVLFGGVFGCSVDGGPMTWGPNAFANEAINGLLNAFFNQGAQPTAWYLAPFSSNTTPTTALTAAAFASTQGEYTAYTQGTRQVWTPDGASTAQSMVNSSAPAQITIGASAVTLYGAGLLSTSTKGGTTGTLAAAGLFGTANALNPASTLSMQYTLSASAS